MSRLIITTLATLMALATAVPAAAQQANVCGKRPDVLGQLSARHSEAPTAMGLSSNGHMVEVLASPAGATWTIIVTLPNGLSCLMAVGEHWEAVKPVVASVGPHT